MGNNIFFSCFVSFLIFGVFLSYQVRGQDEDGEGEDMTEADYYQMVHQYYDAPMSPEGGMNSDQNSPPNGARPGRATRTNSCQHVRGVPSNLRSSSVMKPKGLNRFYQKYTEAYGIPVLSSVNVPDKALKRACYTLRVLLADNEAVRQSFFRYSGRVAVIGRNEGTTSIPEHSYLPNWWNQRARGLGATTHDPVSSGGEENILCYSTDRYYNEDIFLHESAHGVHLIGAARAIPGWDRRLRALYNQARRTGLWASTYSMSTPEEYFAEGVQSWFHVNAYSKQPNGIHGPVNTRTKLKAYDPQLYNLIKEVYPCNNEYLKRCHTSRAREDAQVLRMDCNSDGTGGVIDGTTVAPTTTTTTTTTTSTSESGQNTTEPRQTTTTAPGQTNGTPATTTATVDTTTTTTTTTTAATAPPTTARPRNCVDTNINCAYWAGIGECSNNPGYMHESCRRSCNRCSGGAVVTTTRATTISPYNCYDRHWLCASWASSGECSRNSPYMHPTCPLSCHRC